MFGTRVQIFVAGYAAGTFLCTLAVIRFGVGTALAVLEFGMWFTLAYSVCAIARAVYLRVQCGKWVP